MLLLTFPELKMADGPVAERLRAADASAERVGGLEGIWLRRKSCPKTTPTSSAIEWSHF